MIRRRIVLFDLDGTLVDTAGAGRRALEEAFRRVHGLEDIARLARHVRFGGNTDPSIVLEMARGASLDPDVLNGDRDRFEAAYLEALQAELARPEPRRRVLPGVVVLLETLRRRTGVHVGLLTGNIERGARAKLEVFGLNPYFLTGGFGSDHPDRAEIARVAARRVARLARAEVEPEEVVVVGDTERDVECARVHGFRAIAVLTGWTTRKRLEAARPDVLLPHLGDLDATLDALGC